MEGRSEEQEHPTTLFIKEAWQFVVFYGGTLVNVC
jgi:hypothetical protein